METKPKTSLKDLLAQNGPVATKERGPMNLNATIKPIFGLMGQVESVTAGVINEAIAPLRGGSTDKKAVQRAIQTVMALSTMEVAKEPWEAAAHIDLIRTLREKIATRVIARNKRAFQRKHTEDIEKEVAALTPFRVASKPEESAMAQREMLPPGPAKLGRATHAKAVSGEVPQEIEEIIYALAQFRIGAEKNTRTHLDAAEVESFREMNKALQNARHGQTVEISDAIKAHAEASPGARAEFLAINKAIFGKMSPDEQSIATIENETELFGATAEDVGTELEHLQGIQQEEFAAITELEKAHDLWDKVIVPEVRGRNQTPEELRLSIFQALKTASPTLGKATTMNLVAKLAQDHAWVEKFKENGQAAIFEARAVRNHLVLTDPETGLFGEPSNTEAYLADGKTLVDAVAMVDQAENVLYGEPLNSALQFKNRESALYAARTLIAGEATPAEIESRPMLRSIENTRQRAEQLSQAIFKEIDGREKNLALLPIALKERESITKVESSLVRVITTLGSPEVQVAVRTLLAQERENHNTLRDNTSPDEAEIRTRIHCQEKIATLEAMADLADSQDTIETQDFDNLLKVVTSEAIPKTLRDHALVTLCDNKSKTGVKIKSKEMLDRIENLCGRKHLAGNTRRDLGTLRQWKEKEVTPAQPNKLELAKAVCALPKELKRMLSHELGDALRACLEPSPWKNAKEDSTQKVGLCNRRYFLLKNDPEINQDTLEAVKELHTATVELVRSAKGNDLVTKVKLAEGLASKESGLKTKEAAVVSAILKNPKSDGAISYLANWYNLVGNQHTLRRETGMQKEWQLDPLPLAGARMQSRIQNLLEIGEYAKAVATKPQALAEAYIQHELKEKRGGEDRWDVRVDRMVAKTETEIEHAQAELQEWEGKFNGVFDDQEEEDDLTPEETERKRGFKNICQRKLGQKTREMESLYLKKERLHELKDASRVLNGAENVEEVLANLGSEPSETGVVNIGQAWDNALANLTKTPGKLNLPKETAEITVYQILEGAAIHKNLNRAVAILKQAAKVMSAYRPELKELENSTSKTEVSDNELAPEHISDLDPQELARTLKRAAFQTLKEVEVRLWETGKSIEMAEDEIEVFISENPEVVANRKEWVNNLKKTQSDLTGANELASTLPLKPIEKPKKKNVEEMELH